MTFSASPSLVRLLPSAVTLCGMGCGFFAILMAREGFVDSALWLVFLAVLCDIADGRLARKLGARTPFGAELDSFADSLSFGVAPAVLLYEAALERIGLAGGFVAFFYAAMAVFRLVRFNLDSRERNPDAFRGFSTPTAALYAVSYVAMRDVLPSWLGAVYAVSLGWLMVSSVPSPAFKGSGLSSLYLLVALVNTAALLLLPGPATFAWWNVFNVVALVLSYRTRAPAARSSSGCG